MKFSKFFSYIQEANWYRQFLNPVIEEVERNTKLLDIGTGTGKLLEILSKEKAVSCIGVDTNQAMLDEAKIKLTGTTTKLLKIEPNKTLPFKNNTFDNVTICNVLFNLRKDSVYNILDESKRVLKKRGKIIILTPTGNGSFLKLTKNFLSLNNLSIFLWYYATKNRASPWVKKGYLLEYCKNNNLEYYRKVVFKGFAQVEIISIE